VRGVRRLLLERPDDHALDLLVADRARLAGARLVVQPIQTAARETAAPLADRRLVAVKPRGDPLAWLTVGGGEHDPAAQRERLRALRPPSPALEHFALLVRQHHFRKPGHPRLPSSLATTTDFDTKRLMPAN
jgi:hypothetical protein